jgi:hypothetical protein
LDGGCRRRRRRLERRRDARALEGIARVAGDPRKLRVVVMTSGVVVMLGVMVIVIVVVVPHDGMDVVVVAAAMPMRDDPRPGNGGRDGERREHGDDDVGAPDHRPPLTTLGVRRSCASVLLAVRTRPPGRMLQPNRCRAACLLLCLPEPTASRRNCPPQSRSRVAIGRRA